MDYVLRWKEEPSDQPEPAKIVRRDGAYYVEATGNHLTLIVGPVADEAKANHARDRMNCGIKTATEFLRRTSYDMPSVELH